MVPIEHSRAEYTQIVILPYHVIAQVYTDQLVVFRVPDEDAWCLVRLMSIFIYFENRD
jgi:hypothetical protein